MEEAAEDEAALKAKREKLAKVKENLGVLEAFCKDIANNRWGDITCRNIGHVDWAPEISIDVQGHKYTKDIGTFEVDAAKFKAQFKGNVVDLGAFYSSSSYLPCLIKTTFRIQVYPPATNSHVLPSKYW